MIDNPGILRNTESGELVHQSCVEIEDLPAYDHVEAITVTGGSCSICDEPLVEVEDDVVIDDVTAEEEEEAEE